MQRHRVAGYIVACILMCIALLVTYLQLRHVPPPVLPAPSTVKGDLHLLGGKLLFPPQHGPVLEVGADKSLQDRHGLGVYPDNSLRLYAARGGDLRLGFAQEDGGFHDALLIAEQGDIGIGVEPLAKLHVGGNLAVNGSVGVGPYVLSATGKGLQVCRQGGRCLYLLEEDA